MMDSFEERTVFIGNINLLHNNTEGLLRKLARDSNCYGNIESSAWLCYRSSNNYSGCRARITFCESSSASAMIFDFVNGYGYFRAEGSIRLNRGEFRINHFRKRGCWDEGEIKFLINKTDEVMRLRAEKLGNRIEKLDEINVELQEKNSKQADELMRLRSERSKAASQFDSLKTRFNQEINENEACIIDEQNTIKTLMDLNDELQETNYRQIDKLAIMEKLNDEMQETNYKQIDELARLSEAASQYDDLKIKYDRKITQNKAFENDELNRIKLLNEIIELRQEDELSKERDLNAELTEENVALKNKITDLTKELSEKNSVISKQKQFAMKKSPDSELEIDQLYLKIENMEKHNIDDNVIWREMDTENLKLKEQVKVLNHMLEQQQDLLEVLKSRKSISPIHASTQTNSAKTEISHSMCHEKTQQMLKIFKADNSELSSKNRDLIICTKILEDDVVELKNKKDQLTEQLEEAENTLKMMKTEKEEYRVKNNDLNAVLKHRVEDIERLKTYSDTLANKNTELELDMKHRTRDFENLAVQSEKHKKKTNSLQRENKSVKLCLTSQRKKLKRIVDVLGTEFNGLHNFHGTDSEESSSGDELQSKRSKTDVNNN